LNSAYYYYYYYLFLFIGRLSIQQLFLNLLVHFVITKQVRVKSPPSVLNMTLPAFVAKRGCSYPSISAARARAQQQTSRTPLLLLIDGTDRRT